MVRGLYVAVSHTGHDPYPLHLLRLLLFIPDPLHEGTERGPSGGFSSVETLPRHNRQESLRTFTSMPHTIGFLLVYCWGVPLERLSLSSRLAESLHVDSLFGTQGYRAVLPSNRIAPPIESTSTEGGREHRTTFLKLDPADAHRALMAQLRIGWSLDTTDKKSFVADMSTNDLWPVLCLFAIAVNCSRRDHYRHHICSATKDSQ